MRLDRDETGAWIVDPAVLARRLGVTASHLKSQVSRGLVSSRVETGSESDEGRSRVTVITEQSGWQGLFDCKGSLISERVFNPS